MPRIILSGCRPADRRERIACSDVCTSTDGMLIIREHGDVPRDAYRVRAGRRTSAADDGRTRERPCAETPAVIGRDGTGTDGTRIPPAAVSVGSMSSGPTRYAAVARYWAPSAVHNRDISSDATATGDDRATATTPAATTHARGVE